MSVISGEGSEPSSPTQKTAEKPCETGKKCHHHHSAVIIMSALATMINTENIWRFPRVAAQHSNGQGCLLFVMAWLLFLPLWAIPMIMVEFAIGRYTSFSVYQSVRRLMGDKYGWCGLLVTAITFLYGCTFLVTMSWCVYYVYYFSLNQLPTNLNDSNLIFNEHVYSAWPLLWELYIIIPVCLIIIRGFDAVGFTNVVVVVLIFLSTGTVLVWQLTRERAGLGLAFFFSPSWETLLDPGLWTSALSHNAYDVGTGLCLILTYATMLGPKHSIVKYGVLLPIVDASISLLCAMLAFSLTFSVLYDANNEDASYSAIVKILQQPGKADSGITFTWIPVLFSRAGEAGRPMCIMYFVAISSAAFTSFINLFEFTVRFLRDCNVPRIIAVIVIAVSMFLVSIPSAMNTHIFVNQSTVWRAGTFLSCFVLLATVLKFGTESFSKLAFNEYSNGDWPCPRVWVFMIKYVVPVELICLFVWYIVTEIMRAISHGAPWYAFTADSLTTTIVEWSLVLLGCCLANLVACACIKTESGKEQRDYQPIND